MAGKELGVAVIGSGRMGTLRANLVSTYPSTRFVGVADVSDDAAQKLGKSVNANVITTDIDAPDPSSGRQFGHRVDAGGTAPRRGDQGTQGRQAVLVEKPIAVTLEDADE